MNDQPTQPNVLAVALLLACLAWAGSGCQPDPAKDPTPTPQTAANAAHPVAGRSAFPEADETLSAPIPAVRLSDLDPFTSAIDPADIPDVVAWDQALKYVGYDITVEGTIVNVGRSRDGEIHFLNFHQDWRGKFYMVVFEDLAKTLDQPVEDVFKGKRLRVKGKVEAHRGRPQIKILSMDQVEFAE